jgi:hypothetical protein
MALIEAEEVQAYVEAELSVPNRSRTMAFADAWQRIAITILERVLITASDPTQQAQRGLGKRLLRAWRTFAPFAFADPDMQFPFDGEAVDVLRGYYRNAITLKALVRTVAATLYPIESEQADLVASLDRIEAHCREQLAAIDVIAATNQVLASTAGFVELATCHQDMLVILLGPRFSEEFAVAYDSAMATVDTLLQASRARGRAN